MSRKVLAGLLTGLFLTVTIGMAEATPIYFVVDEDKSSVIVEETSSYNKGSLTASLAKEFSPFTLNDLEPSMTSQTFDFFNFTATGDGWLYGGSANISATLVFSEPAGLEAQADGGAEWVTFFGQISFGVLTWDNTTLPDSIKLADENTVSIDFESGVAITCGAPVTVHATVTNLGGAPLSVPEPTNMLLIGSGIIGISGIARRKKK